MVERDVRHIIQEPESHSPSKITYVTDLIKSESHFGYLLELWWIRSN